MCNNDHGKTLSKLKRKKHDWMRYNQMGRVKRIWYLSPMRAAKVQVSLRSRAVSPEPPLLAHTSSESRGTFRQKARSLAPLNGWACAVKIYHEGMLEDTNSLDGAQMTDLYRLFPRKTDGDSLAELLCSSIRWVPSSDFVSSSIPSWQTLTAHAQPFKRGQGSGFLSEGSFWLTACMSEQRRFWRDSADAQARLNLRCSHRRWVPNSLDAVQVYSTLVLLRYKPAFITTR